MRIMILAAACLALLALPAASAAQDYTAQQLQAGGESDAFQQMLQRRADAAAQQRQMPSAQEEANRRAQERAQAAYEQHRTEMAAADGARLQCDRGCDEGYQQCWRDNTRMHEVCPLNAGQCRNSCTATYDAALADAKARYDANRTGN